MYFSHISSLMPWTENWMSLKFSAASRLASVFSNMPFVETRM